MKKGTADAPRGLNTHESFLSVGSRFRPCRDRPRLACTGPMLGRPNPPLNRLPGKYSSGKIVDPPSTDWAVVVTKCDVGPEARGVRSECARSRWRACSRSDGQIGVRVRELPSASGWCTCGARPITRRCGVAQPKPTSAFVLGIGAGCGLRGRGREWERERGRVLHNRNRRVRTGRSMHAGAIAQSLLQSRLSEGLTRSSKGISF